MIRMATPADAPAVQEIYAPIVRDTATSFEYEIPTVEEMRRRIEATLEKHPWLVCERDSRVIGYAYAGTHRARAAYQWTAEVSVYVAADARRGGVAFRLYTALFDELRRRGFHMAVAGITLPNPPSVALHERMGFVPLGVFHEIGYKFGAWRDVGWWEMKLQTLPSP